MNRILQIVGTALTGVVVMADALHAEGDFVTVEWSEGDGERWTVSGLADREAGRPMATNTVFAICSNTKPLASVLVLTFVEEGVLNLDDPVSKHFPEFAEIRLKGKCPKNPVTLRHLITHTTGIDAFSLCNPGVKPDMTPFRDQVRLAVAKGLRCEPGTEYRYSNAGFGIMGAILEKVTGRKVADLMQERIFNPLGMADATFYPDGKILERAAVPYYFPPDGSAPMRYDFTNRLTSPLDDTARTPLLSSCVFCTAGDYLKFSQMIACKGLGLNGRRILSEKTFTDYLLTRQTPPGDKTDASFDIHFNAEHTQGGKGGLFATSASWNWADRSCKVVFRAKSPYAPKGVESKLDATGFGGGKTVFGIDDRKVADGKASCLVSNNDDRHGIATVECLLDGVSLGTRTVELAIGEAKRVEFDCADRPQARVEFRIVTPSAAERAWDRGRAERLLRVWCDSLVRHQLRDYGDPALDGAVICPACGLCHGRIGDAVQPLVSLWARSGDRRYLEAAERAVDWTEANVVRPDGSNVNDLKAEWRGITAFAQAAMGRTLLRYGNRLSDPLRKKWEAVFRRQTDYLLKTIPSERFVGMAVINYPCAFCESMALAWKLSGEDRYRAAAERMVRDVVMDKFLPDGLLAGEGHPTNGRTPRGCAYVDLGYNLEESLPALAAAAEMLKDDKLKAKVRASALAHLEFLVPDGAIDDSAGSRSSKWTYYGSRTSDGVLPLLGFLLRDGVEWSIAAIEATVALQEHLTARNGMLYGGYSYADAEEPACVHHTFAHAKGLAEFLDMGVPARGGDGRIPRAKARGERRFPSMDVSLVSVGGWRATFSANDGVVDANRYDDLSTGGGSLTFLWHETLGPLVAASMARFFYIERDNMQDQRHDVEQLTMTPHVECGEYMSLRDRKVRVDSKTEPGRYEYRVEGDKATWSYALTERGLEFRCRAASDFMFAFPLMAEKSVPITRDGSRVKVELPRGTVVLESNRPIRLRRTLRGDRAFNTIAGNESAYFEIVCEGGVELEFSLTTAGL